MNFFFYRSQNISHGIEDKLRWTVTIIPYQSSQNRQVSASIFAKKNNHPSEPSYQSNSVVSPKKAVTADKKIWTYQLTKQFYLHLTGTVFGLAIRVVEIISVACTSGYCSGSKHTCFCLLSMISFFYLFTQSNSVSSGAKV
jgi:hypothetical protein